MWCKTPQAPYLNNTHHDAVRDVTPFSSALASLNIDTHLPDYTVSHRRRPLLAPSVKHRFLLINGTCWKQNSLEFCAADVKKRCTIWSGRLLFHLCLMAEFHFAAAGQYTDHVMTEPSN